ncbi:Protein SPA1-RELATED 2 [Morella rubra]|uniref:Protein SPA1-RELATED 2 n=1 Tax=Morella rubra TaxID=262757 RepID=A0A6A1UK08_9ROSI|nr:Protein SPA1-RELATED 2 [Morella rubra]
MDSMAEGVGDEVTPLGAVEGIHLQSKESEYSWKSENCNMLESQEMIIPGEGDYSQNPPQEFAVQEGKNINRSINHVDGVEHPNTSPCSIDDAGIMVEELRVTNYNGSNLAIVGTSNSRQRMQGRQNHWQHLYQLAGGSGGGNPHGDSTHRDNGQGMSSFWEDMGCASFPELLAQKPSSDDRNEKMEQLPNTENEGASGNNPGGIRTKIISKSGFSEFFVKQTLKGKGIICRGPLRDSLHIESRDQNNLKIAGSTKVASDVLQSLASRTETPSPKGAAVLGPGGSEHDGVTLRQWLKGGHHKASKVKCLHIFKQIVDVVDGSHSQGVALKDLRPSCFRLLPSNQVKYIRSPVQRELLDGVVDHNILHTDNSLTNKRPLEQVMFPSAALYAKKQKFQENVNFSGRWHQFSSRSGYKHDSAYSSINISGRRDSCNVYREDKPGMECETQSKFSIPYASNIAQRQLTSLSDQLEEKWYRSPEELIEDGSTTSSNIYCLGVLLFEVRCCFSIYHLKLPFQTLKRFTIPPNTSSSNHGHGAKGEGLREVGSVTNSVRSISRRRMSVKLNQIAKRLRSRFLGICCSVGLFKKKDMKLKSIEYTKGDLHAETLQIGHNRG